MLALCKRWVESMGKWPRARRDWQLGCIPKSFESQPMARVSSGWAVSHKPQKLESFIAGIPIIVSHCQEHSKTAASGCGQQKLSYLNNQHTDLDQTCLLCYCNLLFQCFKKIRSWMAKIFYAPLDALLQDAETLKFAGWTVKSKPGRISSLQRQRNLLEFSEFPPHPLSSKTSKEC